MRSFFLAAGIGAFCAIAYVGCGLTVEGELADTGAGPAGSTGTGMMDGGKPCEQDDDCPLSSDCATWSCKSGECDLDVAPDDTPLPTGSVVGDCKKNVCQGGKPAVLPDDTDLVEDNDPCTVEACNGGTKQAGPAPDGTACGDTGNLGCLGGLCEGCNTDPANCNKPTQCQVVTCPVNTCVYEIQVGKVVSDPDQEDCKQEVCDVNGDVAITGDLTETPPQMGDDCLIEVCTMAGGMEQIVDNDGLKCANPIGVCYNDSQCAAGVCAPQPKPMGKLGDDGMPGNCQAKFCDGMGVEVTLADDTDVPPDPDMGDCMGPMCSGGVLDPSAPEPDGEMCINQPGGKCCGAKCCPNANAGAGEYCDMNKNCCVSGKQCGGTCCPGSDDKCANTTCCAGNVCNNACCPTDHKCTGAGACCPVSQRCPNGTDCCPMGQTCNASNVCS